MSNAWNDRVPLNPDPPSPNDAALIVNAAGNFVRALGRTATFADLASDGANSGTSAASITIKVAKAGTKIAIFAAYGGTGTVGGTPSTTVLTILANGVSVDTLPLDMTIDSGVPNYSAKPAVWVHVHVAAAAGDLTLSAIGPTGPTRIIAFPLPS